MKPQEKRAPILTSDAMAMPEKHGNAEAVMDIIKKIPKEGQIKVLSAPHQPLPGVRETHKLQK